MRFLIVAGASALSLLACSPTDNADTSAAASDPYACADGAPRLTVTGLCQAEALALLPSDPEARSPEREGCTWSAGETAMPGNEALLYRAATCNGVTTQLSFAGGAHSADISYETSALFGPSAAGRTLIRFFGTDPDPQGALAAAIAALPAAEQRACAIRPAGYEGWPADALVIAPTEAARARLPQNEPITACGPFGLNEDELNFWRVRQGYAAFYTLGQEQPDFDAYAMQVIVRDSEGNWSVKP